MFSVLFLCDSHITQCLQLIWYVFTSRAFCYDLMITDIGLRNKQLTRTGQKRGAVRHPRNTSKHRPAIHVCRWAGLERESSVCGGDKVTVFRLRATRRRLLGFTWPPPHPLPSHPPPNYNVYCVAHKMNFYLRRNRVFIRNTLESLNAMNSHEAPVTSHRYIDRRRRRSAASLSRYLYSRRVSFMCPYLFSLFFAVPTRNKLQKGNINWDRKAAMCAECHTAPRRRGCGAQHPISRNSYFLRPP